MKTSGKSTKKLLEGSPRANASAWALSFKLPATKISATTAHSNSKKLARSSVSRCGTLPDYHQLRQVSLINSDHSDAYLKEARKLWPQHLYYYKEEIALMYLAFKSY